MGRETVTRLVAESRKRQNLPATITDPVVVADIVELLMNDEDPAEAGSPFTISSTTSATTPGGRDAA
jgi:hypothetical protein